MEWQPIVDQAFYGLMSGGVIVAVRFLGALNKSIGELNVSIAKVIEKIADHDYRLQRLETQKDKEEKK